MGARSFRRCLGVSQGPPRGRSEHAWSTGITKSSSPQINCTPFGLDALDEASIVVLPSWRGASERPPDKALAAIRAAHADGAIVVSFCLGGFVLAATGLLNGRRAAAHWFYAPTLATMYPRVSVDPEVLFVDDGDIVTAAGTGAALDACLHLVAHLWGAKAHRQSREGWRCHPDATAPRPRLLRGQFRCLNPARTSQV